MQLKSFAALLALSLAGVSFAAPLPDSYASALVVRAPADGDASGNSRLKTNGIDNEDEEETSSQAYRRDAISNGVDIDNDEESSEIYRRGNAFSSVKKQRKHKKQRGRERLSQNQNAAAAQRARDAAQQLRHQIAALRTRRRSAERHHNLREVANIDRRIQAFQLQLEDQESQESQYTRLVRGH